MTRFASFAALAIGLAATTACTSAHHGAASANPGQTACVAPLKPAIEHQVYFGRDRGPRGEVTEAQWQRFVTEVVTPRFPEGLSILNVAGQSRTGASNALLRERTKLLVVLVPASAPAGAKIEEVAAAYRTRFDQRAVFRVDRPACASL